MPARPAAAIAALTAVCVCPAQAETQVRCQARTAAGAGSGRSAPERRVLFAEPAPAEGPAARPPPPSGGARSGARVAQAPPACKGKMPAEDPGGMRGHPGGGDGGASGGSGTEADAGGAAMNFLQGRKRQLGEALEDVARSSAALDDMMARSRKRRGGCGESTRSGSCHSAAREDSGAYAEDGGEWAGGTHGGREADLVEELLESILRAGDERVASQARSRAAASAPPLHLPLPPAAAAGPSSSSAAAAAAAAAPAAAAARSRATQAEEWSDVSTSSSQDALVRVTNWSRSLVRRVRGDTWAPDRGPAAANGLGAAAFEGNGGAEAGGVGRRGGGWEGLVWRVCVSGSCSGCAFRLSFLVNSSAESVELETVEVREGGREGEGAGGG